MRYCIWLLALAACDRTVDSFETCKGSCAAILITPSNPVVTAGKTVQLSADVVGNASASVTFSADAGSITPEGLYTAPQTPGTYHITASAAGAVGTEPVTVAPQPVSPGIDVGGRLAVTQNGGPYTASIDSPVDGLTYTWSISGGTLSAASGASVTFLAGAGGLLLLTTQVTNAAGDTAPAGVLVLNIVPPLQTPALDVPQTVTTGRSDLTALVSNPQADSTYAWQETENGTVTPLTGDGPQVTFTSGAAGDTLVVSVQETTASGDTSGWIDSASISVAPVGVSLIAGVPGGVGTINGSGGTTARFDFSSVWIDPDWVSVSSGAVSDASGNLFVVDTNNRAIRKVTPSGTVSLVAGTIGLQGHLDAAAGANAVFEYAGAIALSGGTLYVADQYAVSTSGGSNFDTYCSIRSVDPAGGATSTLFSSSTTTDGDDNGWCTPLPVLAGATIAGKNWVYASDGTHVYRFDPTTASSIGTKLDTSSCATIEGIAYNAADGNIIAISQAGKLCTMPAAGGAMTTKASTSFNFGDGTSVAVDGSGNVYLGFQYGVAYSAAGYTAPITVAGTTTIVDNGTSPFYALPADGTGTKAAFAGITALAWNGTALFAVDVDTVDNNDPDLNNSDADNPVEDPGEATIRQIASAKTHNGAVVSTFAGAPRAYGNANAPNGLAGTPPQSPARFGLIAGATVSGSDSIFVGDCNDFAGLGDNAPTFDNAQIRNVSLAGDVSTFAGNGASGNANGVGTDAEFTCPRGLATSPSGDIVVVDSQDNTVRGIEPNRLVYPIAGDASNGAGFLDGVGNAAQFSAPSDAKVDTNGNIYVTDTNNCAIREILPGNSVTTLVDFRANPGIVFPANDPSLCDPNADSCGDTDLPASQPQYDLCPIRGSNGDGGFLSLAPRALGILDGGDLVVAINDINALVSVISRVSVTDSGVQVTPVVGCQSPSESGGGAPGSCTNNLFSGSQAFYPTYYNVNVNQPCLNANLRNPRALLVTSNDSVLIADDQVLDRVTHFSDPTQCRVNTIVGSSNTGVNLVSGSLANGGFNLLRGLALTRSGDVIAVDEDEGVVLLVRYN